MSVTPEEIQERIAARAADAAIAQEETDAHKAVTDAEQALAAAQARTAEVATRRQQSAARVKAADDAILAKLKPGEMRTTHPNDVEVLVRDGDTLQDGTLYSVHSDPTPS